MDLMLNTQTNDLSINGGDIQTITGIDEAGQRIKDRLLTFINEWFLNLAYGVDYFGRIYVKNPRTSVVAAHLRSEILKSVDGKITSFSSEINNRQLNANYTVLIDGESISGQI